jgi:hypothetical protein
MCRIFSKYLVPSIHPASTCVLVPDVSHRTGSLYTVLRHYSTSPFGQTNHIIFEGSKKPMHSLTLSTVPRPSQPSPMVLTTHATSYWIHSNVMTGKNAFRSGCASDFAQKRRRSKRVCRSRFILENNRMHSHFDDCRLSRFSVYTTRVIQ